MVIQRKCAGNGSGAWPQCAGGDAGLFPKPWDFCRLGLDGSTLREGLEDRKALFGKSLSNVQIFSQQGVVVPAMGKALVGQLNRVLSWEKK